MDEEFLALARRERHDLLPDADRARRLRRDLGEAARAGNAPELDDPNGCDRLADRARMAVTAEDGAARRAGRHAARARDSIEARPCAATMAREPKRVQRAGIPIAMGTDAGNPLTLHGPSVFAEMEAMQRAGMTPLRGASSPRRAAAARAMGRGDGVRHAREGQDRRPARRGRRPARDIANLRKLELVMRAGVARSDRRRCVRRWRRRGGDARRATAQLNFTLSTRTRAPPATGSSAASEAAGTTVPSRTSSSPDGTGRFATKYTPAPKPPNAPNAMPQRMGAKL